MHRADARTLRAEDAQIGKCTIKSASYKHKVSSSVCRRPSRYVVPRYNLSDFEHIQIPSNIMGLGPHSSTERRTEGESQSPFGAAKYAGRQTSIAKQQAMYKMKTHCFGSRMHIGKDGAGLVIKMPGSHKRTGPALTVRQHPSPF